MINPLSATVSSSNTSGLEQSLINNPQIIQSMIPGVNLSALASTLQIETSLEEQPLTNLNTQLATFSKQSHAWSQVSTALQTIQTDIGKLATVQDMNPSSQPVSSDSNAVTASGATAAVGQYNVSVTSLAAPQLTNSNVVASSPTSALGYSGTLTVSYNGHSAQVTVSSTDSLDTIDQNLQSAAATLSGLNLSVSELPSSSGTALSLSANTGSGSFTVSASGSNLPLTFTTTASHNAVYTVNGVQNQSPTNTVTDALASGTTLNLLETTASPVTLTVSANMQQVDHEVGTLVSDISSAVQTINQLTGRGGVLEGNAALLNVSQNLVSFLSQTNPSLPAGYQSLLDMGLSVSWSKSQGESISFNGSQFQQALNTDPNAVTALFTGLSTSGTASGTGIYQTMNGYLSQFLAPSTGIVASAQSGITQQEQTIGSEEKSLQQLVQQEQTNTDNQFIADLQNMLQNAALKQALNAQLNPGASGSGSSNSSGG